MSKYNITIDLEKDDTSIDYIIAKLKLHGNIVDVENVKEVRTNPQNNSIHLWLDHTAKRCVELGITMQMVLEKRLEIMPTGILLKESLWKFTQKKMFGKKSTTQLNKTGEINDIIDVLTLHFSELGVEVEPFPSNEYFREEYK